MYLLLCFCLLNFFVALFQIHKTKTTNFRITLFCELKTKQFKAPSHILFLFEGISYQQSVALWVGPCAPINHGWLKLVDIPLDHGHAFIFSRGHDWTRWFHSMWIALLLSLFFTMKSWMAWANQDILIW